MAIFGICGACRTSELAKMQVNDVEDLGSSYLVKIPETESHAQRTFTIPNKFYQTVHRYTSLRPKKAATPTRFFLHYRNGKCTLQTIGKNVFSQTPRKIATYLGLPEPERYTGMYAGESFVQYIKFNNMYENCFFPIYSVYSKRHPVEFKEGQISSNPNILQI